MNYNGDYHCYKVMEHIKYFLFIKISILMNYKICIINQGFYKYSIGGAEVQLYLLAKELLRNNYEVFYVTNDVNSYQEVEGIKLYPYIHNSNFTKKSCAYFNEVIDRLHPDLIFQRGRKAVTFYAGNYSQKYRVPFIFAASMDIDCKKLKSTPRLFKNRNKFKQVLSLPFAIYEDYKTLHGMKNANIVLAQSAKQKDLLFDNLGIKSEIIRNYHPIVKEVYSKEERPVVLWLASIKTWKQPELFMKLSNTLKDVNCQFILAGRMAEERYRDKIEAWSKSSNNFKYLENVDFEKSNELIGKASIFVNTSLKNEGFPNTFIQAWHRKTPTVTLNFDPDGVIKREKLGFHSGSFEQLLKDVNTLIEDRAKRNEIGENAFNYAKLHFSRGESIDKLLCLIKNVVNNGN
ncbi:MAG: glycosyltransferase [Candidatus Lokiarchaeota archaeon]|nr:glycosyltransferase [Candidatus Lokiarchaeota archaeon]